jgi:hypothetical protein
MLTHASHLRMRRIEMASTTPLMLRCEPGASRASLEARTAVVQCEPPAIPVEEILL